MICSNCGGRVEWRGPLSNLTHTECLACGATNAQMPDDDGECRTCAEAIETRVGPCDECGALDEDDGYPGPCSDPGGHEWPAVEEDERCLCVHCGADGDA